LVSEAKDQVLVLRNLSSLGEQAQTLPRSLHDLSQNHAATAMYDIVYLVGLIVVVMFILSVLGLR
jgi:hypothetical protein